MPRFIQKIKNLIVTFRLSILSVFVTFFIIAMLSLIAITYFRFSSAMSVVAVKLMSGVSADIYNATVKEFKREGADTTIGARMLQEKVVDPNNIPQLTKFLYIMMQSELKKGAYVQSIFWSNEKGDIILVGKETDTNLASDILRHTDSTATRVVTHYDQNNNIVSSASSENTSFDPRTRPWYVAAKTTGETAITDIFQYKFFGPPYWGIVIATPAYSANNQLLGVFGVGIRVDFLRHYIEKFKISENSIIFIVSDDRRLIAYPNLVQYLSPEIKKLEYLKNPWLTKSFDIYQQFGISPFNFQLQNKNYSAMYKPILKFGDHMWYLGIVVPEEDFVGQLIKTNYITIAISLIILLLSIFIVSIIISRTIKPLRQLENETLQIKDFHLQGDIKIQSRIKEIINLTAALQAMKKGLRLFQKYVPATLVRQLIETGKEGEIEGEKKQLVVFFSDIKNFTTIAEREDPTQLMTQICQYLDELTKIIIEEGGTIDKYIGDSIMAFWGAPLTITSPDHHAVKAAIRCQRKLNMLNENWKSKNKAEFFTRIGIHHGEAIVGNLGSSERLTYTALGDTINTASRLESINKIYGTNIIVSEVVYHQLKNEFVLRMIDYVILKGKEQGMYIYEIVAENIEEITWNIHQYNEIFSKAFAAYRNQNWQDAIRVFEKCLAIYPQDNVAHLFIKRCGDFQLHPPPKNWNGEWYFTQK